MLKIQKISTSFKKFLMAIKFSLAIKFSKKRFTFVIITWLKFHLMPRRMMEDDGIPALCYFQVIRTFVLAKRNSSNSSVDNNAVTFICQTDENAQATWSVKC